MKIPFQHLAACLWLISALGLGCRSPQKQVEKRMPSLQQQWSTNVAHQLNLPEKVLDWNEAKEVLLAHNSKLLQASNEVVNAREMVRQVFKDLIPSLNLQASVTKRLQSLATTTLDDVSFSADSFFNIPGFVNFGSRLYSARLVQLRAQLACELTRREQVIELYRLFWSAESMQHESEHLALQKQTAVAIAEVDPVSGHIERTRVDLAALGVERDRNALQQRASELLGGHEYRWAFHTNGLPALDYHLDPLPVADTNRVAQLQMKLVALELEAARAQIAGIKLRYWPELNIFITGPPVYRRGFGQERFWDAGEVRATANLSWYVDTRGEIARQLRQTRRQQALQLTRIREDSIGLIDRLRFTQSLLEQSVARREEIEFQLAVLAAVPPAQNLAAMERYANDYEGLVRKQRNLDQEIAELSTLFWFVDDVAWQHGSGPMARAEATVSPAQ